MPQKGKLALFLFYFITPVFISHGMYFKTDEDKKTKRQKKERKKYFILSARKKQDKTIV